MKAFISIVVVSLLAVIVSGLLTKGLPKFAKHRHTPPPVFEAVEEEAVEEESRTYDNLGEAQRVIQNDFDQAKERATNDFNNARSRA